jgi:hypothetical protein
MQVKQILTWSGSAKKKMQHEEVWMQILESGSLKFYADTRFALDPRYATDPLLWILEPQTTACVKGFMTQFVWFRETTLNWYGLGDLSTQSRMHSGIPEC